MWNIKETEYKQMLQKAQHLFQQWGFLFQLKFEWIMVCTVPV